LGAQGITNKAPANPDSRYSRKCNFTYNCGCRE